MLSLPEIVDDARYPENQTRSRAGASRPLRRNRMIALITVLLLILIIISFVL